jgi:hypothetical protein
MHDTVDELRQAAKLTVMPETPPADAKELVPADQPRGEIEQAPAPDQDANNSHSGTEAHL